MKRWIMIAFALAILCGCIAILSGTAVDPKNYTGEWYYSKDSLLYVFQDGVIECADRESVSLGEDGFCGAYSFAKNKAAIFVIDADGVGKVTELYLVHTADGDVLCEAADGSGTVWFSRNKNQRN